MSKKLIAVVTVMGMVVIGGLGVGGWTYHGQPQMAGIAWAMEWSKDMDCSGCHSAQVASQKDKNLLSNVHAEKGVSCLDCHEEQAMKTQHKAALAGTPVTKLKVDKKACFNCHIANNKHASYEEVAKLTSDFDPKLNPHDSHIGRLECRACHHVHNGSHNKCSECHTGQSWPWKKVP